VFTAKYKEKSTKKFAQGPLNDYDHIQSDENWLRKISDVENTVAVQDEENCFPAPGYLFCCPGAQT